MANANSPRGLEVAGPLLGCHWYEVAAAYATSLFIGDPVILTGTSNQVTSAAAGSTNPILGAVIGVADSNKVPGWQASTGERLNYKPGSSLGKAYVLVADHPMQVFIAQGDGQSSFLDLDDQGGNVPLIASSTGNTMSGQSAWTLDDSCTANASAAEQIRLIRPVDRVDNTVAIAYCDWYCMINNHQRNAGIVGVGV
jgi:hypothetical protein